MFLAESFEALTVRSLANRVVLELVFLFSVRFLCHYPERNIPVATVSQDSLRSYMVRFRPGPDCLGPETV